MTLIEAKETAVKAYMCGMMPCGAKYCEHCKLHVSAKMEKEAFEYLYNLMKERGYHD